MTEKISIEQTPLILIVDDDRTMRSLLNLAMEEEGYRVIEAENGEQCLSEYTHFQPDLILLDAVMPDIDGFTCCQKIRSLPGGDGIPILIITVLDDRESVERAFRVGATDYITKPIHWSVLSQRVRRLLANAQNEARLAVIEEQLRQQQTQEKLISHILEQLVSDKENNNSIEQILLSIRERLQAGRVLIYQLASQTYLESVTTEYPSIEDFSTIDLNFIAKYGEQYQQGKAIVIEDISQADLPLALRQQLQQLNTRSLGIVLIKKNDLVLGLLAIHFSRVYSQNRELFCNQLSDLANLLAIAMV